MTTIIHRSTTRGQSKYNWLDSKHNFSFAGYSDRDRIRFGALRVLNDDVVKPAAGFGKHPHDNMEIISIPLKGSLKHKDTMGHEQIIDENEVQVMSAGTGLFHSEFNASTTEDVNFLQLWIYPKIKNVKPVYNQKYFDPEKAINKWQKLVSGIENEEADLLTIHQNATISRVILEKDEEIKYQSGRSSYGSFMFIVSGNIICNNETFSDRDAFGIVDDTKIKLKALKDSYVLCIEVPDINN